MGPPGGSSFGSVFIALQAAAYFQWLNAAMDAAPQSRPPLLINMDETAILRHVSGLRGTVVKATSKMQVAIDRASLSARRSSISLLACISSDAGIQADLPQVLLGNEHTFTLQVLRSVGSRVGNAILWRQKSAWNNHSTMRKWLTLLTNSLGSLVTTRYVIVLVDVHPSHIDGSIFLHARRCGVRLVYIPAKLTSYLQPCDTHVFALLKQAVRKGWLEEKAKSEKGMICTVSWLKLVCHAVEKILAQRTWRQAFVADGILEGQQGMSHELSEVLGFETCIKVGRVLPSAEEASCIFPSRMKLDILAYLAWETKGERKKRILEEASGPASASAPKKHKGRVIKTLD